MNIIYTCDAIANYYTGICACILDHYTKAMLFRMIMNILTFQIANRKIEDDDRVLNNTRTHTITKEDKSTNGEIVG